MSAPAAERAPSGGPPIVASGRPPWYLPDSLVARAMDVALAEARRALDMGEVPVGAVLLWDGRMLARAHNLRETLADPLAHAECLVIGEAAERLGRWRLESAALVVTLEPCPMCMGAILQARIPLLVYGAADPRAGAAGSLYDLTDDPRFNHRVEVKRGVRSEEASRLLTEFFEGRRGERTAREIDVRRGGRVVEGG